MLRDSFGRTIDYLRLSVTDACNLRCVYCLPPEGFKFSPQEELLSDDEILRIVRVAAKIGIRKVRVTGGEPLARSDIIQLMGKLSGIPGIEDLSLSTNGILLGPMAKDLYRSGIRRLNISLDSLDPERFRAITRWGKLNKVLEGIQKALDVGFSPVKINVVVVRGINSDEIPKFVSLTKQLPLHVRFIELMPIGKTGFFSQEHWMPLAEIQSLCGELKPLEPQKAPLGFGPAIYFKAPGSLGTIGFISALSRNFCEHCNRLRLTSKGRLVACLASNFGLNLRELLRNGASDEEIADIFHDVVINKPERHQMYPDTNAIRETFMCAVGG